MITEDQSEVIDYLSRPATHRTDVVDRLETHASIVFLAGEHALKLKRAVRYDYLDYSTCEQRHRMCEAEVRLNRRTAPHLYESLIPVAREPDGSLALAGHGPAVDWVVRMRRFGQDALFDRLAADGRLPLELMAPLGAAIGRLHQRAVQRLEAGGLAGMSRVIEGNARSFDAATDLDAAAVRRLMLDQRAMLLRQGRRLEARRQQGLVRLCHGDLHLRNLVLLDGEPTLFDGIEFNDDLACVDVHYDLAFLLMDLWRLGLHRHANAVWNAYLSFTTDFGGLPLLPLFLSCRAAVRAKTSLATASLAEAPAVRDAARQQARDYLRLAQSFLEPPAPCILAIGGLSGTGKSAVAAALAAELGGAPGGVVVRSDVLRKWLGGVAPTTRLGPASYTAEASQQVYRAVVERCRVVAGGGHAAVADAVFGAPDQRAAIRGAAAAVGMPFVGVWLEASHDTRVARVLARPDDASDADPAVIVRQAREVQPPADWPRVDASRSLDEVVADVLAHARTAAAPGTVAARTTP